MVAGKQPGQGVVDCHAKPRPSLLPPGKAKCFVTASPLVALMPGRGHDFGIFLNVSTGHLEQSPARCHSLGHQLLYLSARVSATPPCKTLSRLLHTFPHRHQLLFCREPGAPPPRASASAQRHLLTSGNKLQGLAVYHFPSAPFILSEEEIKGQDGDLFAAFSILWARMFPGYGSDVVMWEASGLSSAGRGRAMAEGYPSLSCVTDEAGRVYLCLSCHSLCHRTLKLGLGERRRAARWPGRH